MEIPIKVVDDGTKRIDKYFNEAEEDLKSIYGFPLKNHSGPDSIYHTKLKGYNKEALKQLGHYVAESNFNPNDIKKNEIIVAMSGKSECGKSKGIAGFFKKAG